MFLWPRVRKTRRRYRLLPPNAPSITQPSHSAADRSDRARCAIVPTQSVQVWPRVPKTRRRYRLLPLTAPSITQPSHSAADRSGRALCATDPTQNVQVWPRVRKTRRRYRLLPLTAPSITQPSHSAADRSGRALCAAVPTPSVQVRLLDTWTVRTKGHPRVQSLCVNGWNDTHHTTGVSLVVVSAAVGLTPARRWRPWGSRAAAARRWRRSSWTGRARRCAR